MYIHIYNGIYICPMNDETHEALLARIVGTFIAEGEIVKLNDLFSYMNKREWAKALGIRYDRFQRITKCPGCISYDEMCAMARKMHISFTSVLRIIKKQVEAINSELT